MNGFEALTRQVRTIEADALEQTIGGLSKDDPWPGIEAVIKSIAALPYPAERAYYAKRLRDRTGLSMCDIKRSVESLAKNYCSATGKQRETIMRAVLPGLVDVVLDENGAIAYLMARGESLTIETSWEYDGTLYIPPCNDNLPFELPRAEQTMKWHDSEDESLCEDVISYLQRFSYLSDPHWLIIACKVFLSYIQDHADIHYLPMILFYASPERGKSRTGKAVTYISYRGIHVVDMREANLFRFSENLHATIFFDLMNLWKKAEKNGSEDILLLRFEKGAKVSRVLYPEKGPFKDTVYYDVYGPTLIATNEAVHNILDTRCIPVTMPNKPGYYENPTPDKGQGIKERLTAWRARVMSKPLPQIDVIQGIQGRLWDISQPLLQVCKLIYPKGLDDLTGALLEIAGQRLEDKKDTMEGIIVTILQDLAPEGVPEWTIKTGDVVERVNEDRPEGHKVTSQYIGRKLKAMGVRTRHVHGRSEALMGRDIFNALLTQFNSFPPPAETLPNSTKVYPHTPATSYEGRELVESQEIFDHYLPTGSALPEGRSNYVESGRESAGIGGNKINEDRFVIERKALPSLPNRGQGTPCTDRPVPYGECQKHKMKYSPETGGMEPYCAKNNTWCHVVHERRGQP